MLTFEGLTPGLSATSPCTPVTEEMVSQFAALTGDDNDKTSDRALGGAVLGAVAAWRGRADASPAARALAA